MHALRRAAREASLAEGDQPKVYPPILSLDSEEEDSMATPVSITMGDYYKQTDEGHVSRGFIPTDPANFVIKNCVLSDLRDNLFDENAIRDPWTHIARLYEISSM